MNEMIGTAAMVGMGVCGVMMLIWLTRMKKQKTTARIMIAAFAVLGTLLLGLKVPFGPEIMIPLGIVLILLLIADFAVRSAQHPDLNKDKTKDKP